MYENLKIETDRKWIYPLPPCVSQEIIQRQTTQKSRPRNSQQSINIELLIFNTVVQFQSDYFFEKCDVEI